MAIPYYRFFPGDYARDTRHLSLMQHGVYRLLIDLYMDQGGALRNDLQWLYRWLHAESVEEKNAVEFILGEFFMLRDNKWQHKRCEVEIAWREGKSAEARASIAKRWNNERNSDDIRTYYGRNTNQNQNQNQNQKPKLEPEASKPSNVKTSTGTRAKTARVRLPEGQGAAVWTAYQTAYRQRYGTDPVRNAKVNGQLAQFIGRVGFEDAVAMAAWFLGHGGQRYVAQGHSAGVLLMDAEKLHTEWQTGRRITATQAMQSDRTQATGDVFRRLIEESENGPKIAGSIGRND